MADPSEKSCPKCGSPMAIRLGEFVCGDCGYFMALDAPDETGTTRKHTGVAAPVYSEGRRGIATYDDSHKLAQRRKLEKLALVLVTFLSMSLGNYLLNPLFRLEAMDVYSFKSLFFAGLTLAAFVALALFIDWRAFKLLVLGLACLIILVNLWPLYLVSQLTSQLILYKLLADQLLLVWLANLLSRETARTR